MMSESKKTRSLPPFEVLIYEPKGVICTITMNRPERRNALSGQLVNELIVALETAGADPEIRVIVLTGAGGAFCSGGDLSQMSGGGADGASAMPWRGGFVELNLAFNACGKPIIARVERYAYAGGLGLVCACQFAIAEEVAKFGTPEIDRGVFPMMIMANIFRNVPRRKGLEMLLLGERMTAAQAVEMGILNRAVPAEDLDDAVAELAARLASKSPAILRLGLEAFYEQDGKRIEVALPYLQEMLMKCFATEDAREGLMAFMQKREPVWKGR
jgi:enoyl-CoA hydratase/carnithine racemase